MKRIPSQVAFAGIALLAVLSGLPAEAKNKVATDSPIADIESGQPITIVISLGSQKVDIYRSASLVASSQVSSGKPGYATPAGVYSILEKQKWHESNIYSGAPMPWMQRITWSGMALHGGVVPGYPASHGCVRLYPSFASKLFKITNVGANVVIARDRPSPTLIEHPNLFQPLSPPTAANSPPTIARADPYLPAQSSGSSLPPNAAEPMGLAKAIPSDVTASHDLLTLRLRIRSTPARMQPPFKLPSPAQIRRYASW